MFAFSGIGFCSAMLAVMLSVVAVDAVYAQSDSSAEPGKQSAQAERQLVEYPASFFSRYQPATALDMVRQVPGFQIDDGTSDRGFVAAVGNILINDIYPSAKLDSPSAILARIPANQVTRVELLRGQVRGIDLQGQSLVVNVILHDDLPAVVRWDAYVRHHSEGPAKPGVDMSLSHRLGVVEYNAGVRIEREANGETGVDRLLNADRQLLEESIVSQDSTGIDLTGTLNASALLARTLYQFNTRVHYETRSPLEISEITPFAPGIVARDEEIGNKLTIKQLELGGDALRNLSPDLVGKAIFLFYLEGLPRSDTRRVIDSDDNVLSSRFAEGNAVTTEGIFRVEMDWTGLDDHNIQLNAEAAYNSLDGSLEQTIDRGMGPEIVDVPGANTLVEEIRGDFLVKDTWQLDRFELDYGLGAEVSRISQSGDAEQERDFFFIKPAATLTYAPGRGSQIRLHLSREVAQLDFDDFISATVFEDDDLALGNPNLRPDKTWIAELGYERRFGRDSVISLTAYHHWVSDVLDLLPLSEDFEAPGNIGNGRRWGLELESTFPLQWLGLEGAKLDLNARIEDSTVTDPVTGNARRLSNQAGNNAYRTLSSMNKNIGYLVRVDYRQDFEEALVAWGWTVAERDERTLYRVNELDVNDEGYAIDAFIETTRWEGYKVSLVADNILNFTQIRDRTIYTGRRDLTSVGAYELRDRFNGRRITLTVSGSF